ncbi:DUF1043 family protein [Gallaecimonas sp. GXIMD4217]|uniref:YhcB family protein n=1 Tax=Gallaecimonas sp. GXIMD4217 TaxID=3131927 RepID=UPI00311B079B
MSYLSVLIALVLGMVIGLVIARVFGGQKLGEDQLKHELEQTRLELEQYKQDVNDHFEQTAEMLKHLARDYDKLTAHLSQSATSLLSVDADFIKLGSSNDEAEEAPELLENAPRDYANERHGLIK